MNIVQLFACTVYGHSIGVRFRQIKLLCIHALSYVEQENMFMHPMELLDTHFFLCLCFFYFSNNTPDGTRAGTLYAFAPDRGHHVDSYYTSILFFC